MKEICLFVCLFVCLVVCLLVWPILPIQCKYRAYCCTWSHSVARARAHTHTNTHTLGTAPVDEGSALRTDLYLKAQNLATDRHL